MNENFVKNFEDATVSFCNVFEDCETKISSYKKQIDELQQQVSKNEQLYKLGAGGKAKDITPESIFAGMTDADKMNLPATAGNDRIVATDATGNLVSNYNSLSNETKLYFEEKAKEMRAERANIKNDVVTTKASIAILSADLRATIANNYGTLLKEQMKYKASVDDIATMKSDYEDEIRKCTRNRKSIENDARLTHEERIQKVNEQEDKRKKALAGKSVCNALDKVSDVYTEAFTRVLNSIDPTNTKYAKSVNEYLSEENRNMIVDEMDILNSLTELVELFKDVENNYQQVKDLVANIKDQTKKFAKIHTNGSEFVASVNKATSAINSALKEVEKANGLGNGPVPSSQPNPQPQPAGTSQPDPNQPDPNQSNSQPTGTNQPDPNQPDPNQVNPNQPNPQPQPTGTNQPTDPIVSATEEAIKIRSVRSCSLHKNELKTILPAMAAAGLGMITGSTVLPFVGVALGGVGAAIMAYDAGSRLIDRIRMAAVNHKFKKVAKKTTKLLRKGNKGSKVKVFPQPDENGVLKFYVKDGDDVTMIDSNLVAEVDGRQLVDYMNDQLNKSFRYINDVNKKKDTRYETLPNVTVDQLNSPYVEFGGYTKGLENQQFGMLGRIGANAKDMVHNFASRFGSNDPDVLDVDDDDYTQGAGGVDPNQPDPNQSQPQPTGTNQPDPNQPDPQSQQNPYDKLVDYLMTQAEFAPYGRDGIVGVIEFIGSSYASCSDELRDRIAVLLSEGMMLDNTGAKVPCTPDNLQELVDDVGAYLQQLQQNSNQPDPNQPDPQQNTQQPTAAFDPNAALAMYASKFGGTYPMDELQDVISQISLNYDLLNDAELQRKLLEAMTQGTYEVNGMICDVTPTELNSLLDEMNVALGVTPTRQP